MEMLVEPAPAAPLYLTRLPDEPEEETALRIPATYDEYLNALDTVSYTIQFIDGEILIMGQATETHEQLVARLIKLFALHFDELDSHRVLGSNIKLVIPDQKGDFNADLSVVRGPSDYGLTLTGKPSTMRLKNPAIVVEVLSKGTRNVDLGEKFTAYQTIPSLQHILFVDQQAVSVSICSRTTRPDQWLLTHYHQLTDVVIIDDFILPVEAIYRKIDLI